MRRHCHAFHNAWATYISSDLNQRLPAGYFAEANVQFGIEIDVAAFEEAELEVAHELAPAWSTSWSAPAPTHTIPMAILTDTVEVVVFHREAGPTLAGAIALISPANKDRPAHCDAFVSKCAAYLQQGVGLVIVDVVTDRRANLHNELLARLGASGMVSWEAELYAVSYRPVQQAGQPRLAMWETAVTVGDALPTMPLWLQGNLCFPVDLDATYNRTCREQRLIVNGT